MIHCTMADRPIIPRNYLSTLNSMGTEEGRDLISGNPVCISMETYSVGIEEILTGTERGKSRRGRLSVIG